IARVEASHIIKSPYYIHFCSGWPCFFFFFSSRRRHTRFSRDWSSDVCSSDLSQALKRLQCRIPQGHSSGTFLVEIGRTAGCRRRTVTVDDGRPATRNLAGVVRDRKSTRLNSSHVKISYAVFCLKKKKKTVSVS